MDYDNFIWFIKERETIRIKKEGGLSPPWTDDVVLKNCHFLNVDIRNDKRSIQLHNYINDFTTWEKFFYIFLYRSCYSSDDFLNKMTGIWMHDYRNIIHLYKNFYVERIPYLLKLRGKNRVITDVSFHAAEFYYSYFKKQNDFKLIDIERRLHKIFKNLYDFKMVNLSSIIANDLSIQFPDKIDPDSECYIYSESLISLNRRYYARKQDEIEKLISLTGLNYSSLNRSLSEYFKYCQRKRYYEKNSSFRDEWLHVRQHF